MSEIRELHAADRRRQVVISEMLKADQRRSAEMRELRTADHTRKQQLIQTLTVMQSLQGQGLAGGLAQPKLPEEAGSSSATEGVDELTRSLKGWRLMFPEESDKIERYVGGLPDMIHGNIIASKPKTMRRAIENPLTGGQ
ncbi:hypothetical protein Tco_0740322 [Tanacetum coccineum]